MDPTNPVIGLCAEGMAAEQRGDIEAARAAFATAWDRSTDDYDRCVAAHYVARHQNDPAHTLEWNDLALRLALQVGDDQVRGFLPSLYLNLGHSHEELGDTVTAHACYETAARSQDVLGTDGYGDLVRDGIGRGLERTGGSPR